MIWVGFSPTHNFTLYLLVLPGLGETIPAVYRLVAARLKRYLGLLVTLRAGCWIHLAGTSAAVATTLIPETLGSSGRTARRTTLGFIGETLGSEELLLFSREGEGFSAIGTLKCFLGISH